MYITQLLCTTDTVTVTVLMISFDYCSNITIATFTYNLDFAIGIVLNLLFFIDTFQFILFINFNSYIK